MASRIRALAGESLDWDYVLRESSENAILPLVGRHLLAGAPDVIPATFVERMKAAVRANTIRCLSLTAELIKIMDRLRSKGIVAIPYKGPVIAAQAYGDVALREYDDLDLILAQRDLPKARQVMIDLGYREKFPWILSPEPTASLVPGEYNFRDESRGVLVELHTEFTLRHFPVRLNLDGFQMRLVTVSLSGHEVTTFSPEDVLPLLCIHGAKDYWERLSWIADVSELVQSHPGLDWDQVLRRTDSLKCERMVNLGLALAAVILDMPLPAEIFKRLEKDNTVGIVTSEVERRLLSREWSPLQAAGRFRFRRRMVPGYFAGWRYAARLAIAPAEEDCQMVRLPRLLAPLYILLRPLRLIRKYGGIGRRRH
jgi:hypothetical protein